MKLDITQKQITYQDAFDAYKKITERTDERQALLMESRTANIDYGKQSIIATNLALKVSGKNDYFRIEALDEQGMHLLKNFSIKDFSFAKGYEQSENCIEGRVERPYLSGLTEQERITLPGQAKFLKSFMNKFESNSKYAGLYGAVAYDFARNFENIGSSHENEPGEDYSFFMPTELQVFDNIRKTATKHELILGGRREALRKSNGSLAYSQKLDGKQFIPSMTDEEFMEKAAFLVEEIKKGRFMQCVLSNSFRLPLKEHPISSYKTLRDINPSPYNFFFNLGDGEFLYGSSPEIHAVVESGNLAIRPLAGTISRIGNAYDDAMQRIKLLTDPKEIAEHSMLVDLGRNEAYRLCTPESVSVKDIYTIETYPNLYHLASGIQGRLKPDFDSIDVLVTTIPAGTLSGAPKKEAMKAIETLENHRRGFYGGAVGYLAFNGDSNLGITIRSVYVNKNFSRLQAGAGIVLDSIPHSELMEVALKISKLAKIHGVEI